MGEEDTHEKMEWRAVQNRRIADDKFQRAMNRAIKRGAELVRPGTFVDLTPFVGKFYHAEAHFSGCSSSAAMCAELSPDLDSRELTRARDRRRIEAKARARAAANSVVAAA